MTLDYIVAGVPLQTVLREKYPENRTPDIRAVITEMKLRRQRLTIPKATARGWYGAFWKAFGDSLAPAQKRGPEGLIQLDGTTYVCEYEEGMGRWSLRLQGSEVGDVNPINDLPLIRWMNRVRQDVEALARKSAHDR